MTRSGAIRKLLNAAPSTIHELADVLGISFESARTGVRVLESQREVEKTGRTIPSLARGKARNLYQLTRRGIWRLRVS
jgi:predicted ArsR family transcriptional regulator